MSILGTFLQTALAISILGCSLRPATLLPYANENQIFQRTETAFSRAQQRRFRQNKAERDLVIRELKTLAGRECNLLKWKTLLVQKLNKYRQSPPQKQIETMTRTVDVASVETADFIHFEGLPRAPNIGVVIKTDSEGRIKAIAPIHGRIQYFWLSPAKPTIRRKNGRIYNSFIRSKKKSDKDVRYLAGSLVREYRTAFHP